MRIPPLSELVSALPVLFLSALVVNGCSPKAEPVKTRPPALVVTSAVSRQDVPMVLRAVGTVEASESVVIRPQISGELTQVGFREGQDIQKGAVLFQMDQRPYLAALKKAEASLARNRVIMENARKDYERYSQLVRDGIVTQEQAEGFRTRAESAAADLAADQANVESARVQLSYCTVAAPIAGRLGTLAVDRGNVVKANETALVTINRISPIHVAFTVPEKHLSELKQRMAAGRLSVDAEVSGGIHESGKVIFLDNSVDPATGTIRLKASFDNGGRRLWPGQFAELTILQAMLKNAVVVPSQAVQTGQKGTFVFVVRGDSTGEMRPVVVGPVSQGMTVIEKGLSPGERVVIDGQMRVIPDAKVEVKDAKNAAQESISKREGRTAP